MTNPNLSTVTGIVERRNRGGIRVNGSWYNFESRSQGEGVDAGHQVTLSVDTDRVIHSIASVPSAAPAVATPAPEAPTPASSSETPAAAPSAPAASPPQAPASPASSDRLSEKQKAKILELLDDREVDESQAASALEMLGVCKSIDELTRNRASSLIELFTGKRTCIHMRGRGEQRRAS